MISHRRKQSPVFRQQEAALLYGYGAIWLRREGDYAVVEIEHEGKTIAVIREALEANFCHCIEPLGIEDEIKRASAASLPPLKDGSGHNPERERYRAALEQIRHLSDLFGHFSGADAATEAIRIAKEALGQ